MMMMMMMDQMGWPYDSLDCLLYYSYACNDSIEIQTIWEA